MAKRRKFSAEFKARVALEAIRGIRTVSDIAAEYEVHPTQVNQWKKDLLAGVTDVFERPSKRDERDSEKEKDQLHSKIGQLAMEVDWLKKKCRQLQIPLDGER